jgi:hypothetical protein
MEVCLRNKRSIAPIGGHRKGVCASSESGTGCLAGGRWGPILRSQAKEGRGSPEDEKGRHWGSFEIIKKAKYKKRGADLPPFVSVNRTTGLFVTVAISVDQRLPTVTKFAVGFNIARHVVVMISVNVIQVKTILKPDPSITGNRTNPTKMTVVILTIVLLVNYNPRKNFTILASSSTTGAFRLKRPILPLPNLHEIVATFVNTSWKLMPFSEELRFHLAGNVVNFFSHVS